MMRPTPTTRLIALLAAVSALAACATSPEAPRTVTESVDETADAAVQREAAVPAPPREFTATTEVPAGSIEDLYAEPQSPPDVISGLAGTFSLPQLDRKEITREADWYARHQKYLDRVFERAGRYLPHIAAEVRRRGLPTELALLPVVESAYDPFAYSHGRAAGLWQIIPGTGKRFGLKQNWWYDGRRDVVESTRAALDYLEYLRDEFDGDWLLAVAAYNSGEVNVARAIRRNTKAGRPTDFWHLSLPKETRAYVPRLLGLSRVVKDPSAYGVELPYVADAPYFAEVPLEGQVDLALAADLAGIDVEEVYALNPGFNRWATDPDGPHRLQVPVEAAPRLVEALAEMPAGEQVRWERHKVRSGDTLIGLANTYRTTPAVIREVNGLRGDSIRAGSWLMVPTATRSLDQYSLTAGNRLTAKQNQQRAGRTKATHTVKSGESFWSISRKYGVGVRELAAWNGMAPGDTLSVGKKLAVWTKGTPAVTSAGDNARIRTVRYTVRGGDSLYRIASRFRVTVDQLKQWNNLDEKKYLKPGQKLVMYVDVTAQSGG
jgi:membrane-bound lytic murein transglycosylase D